MRDTAINEHFFPPHLEIVARVAEKMGVPEEEAIARLAEVGMFALALADDADASPVVEALFREIRDAEKFEDVLGTAWSNSRTYQTSVSSRQREEWAEWRKELLEKSREAKNAPAGRPLKFAKKAKG